jgi:hypothetical protein
MGWASDYIARLQSGETVQFCPRGNSMGRAQVYELPFPTQALAIVLTL